jgi:hypothetical protein
MDLTTFLNWSCSPDTYTHYAAQDGVHAMFTGEISDWPGIDMMSAQHDGGCRQLPGSLRLQHGIMPCMPCSLYMFDQFCTQGCMCNDRS